MGITISYLFGQHTISTNFLVVGLDGAGKTTILQKLGHGEIITTLPVMGFSHEFVQYNNFAFSAWDIGGQGQATASLIWKQYVQKIHGIIFVVDSNDRERISKAREQLHCMLDEAGPRETFLLVIANKQDLRDALNASEITDKLGLYDLRQTTWHIQATCATSGDGLCEGLEWLTKCVKK